MRALPGIEVLIDAKHNFGSYWIDLEPLNMRAPAIEFWISAFIQLIDLAETIGMISHEFATHCRRPSPSGRALRDLLALHLRYFCKESELHPRHHALVVRVDHDTDILQAMIGVVKFARVTAQPVQMENADDVSQTRFSGSHCIKVSRPTCNGPPGLGLVLKLSRDHPPMTLAIGP